MDITQLPFDADTMLAGLRPWVECESPTFDATRVNAMLDLAARDCAVSGAAVERIAGRMGFGDCVRATFSFGHEPGPGILVMGHFDTVHPVGTLGVLPWRREENRCYGPGIFDMKGGNFIALEAVRTLQRLGLSPALPVTFLFTPDEEVGSPSTRDLIEAEAARHKYVLVPEPGRADGGVVTGRYAIARFNLKAVGRPSHAGSRLKDGRSAIRIMADMIPQIEGMTTDACTFSVGVVHGGQWVNCVSSSTGRGAQHGQAPGRSRQRRRADAGADQGRRSVRALRRDARGDAASVGAERQNDGAVRDREGAGEATRDRSAARELRRRLRLQFHRRAHWDMRSARPGSNVCSLSAHPLQEHI